VILIRQSDPGILRIFGHSRFQEHGRYHEAEAAFGRADRLCPAAGREWSDSRGDLPQDGGIGGDVLPAEETVCRNGVVEIRPLKPLGKQNTKLKRSVADPALDKTTLQDALRKKC
jgi:hypothetical protein